MFGTLLVAGLCLGCIYGLVALGYSLIYKASGQMSFAQGDILTLGGYIGFTFYKILGIPFGISLILTLVVMFMFGIGIQRGIITTVSNRTTKPIFLIFATIAISTIIQSAVPIIWGTEVKSYGSLSIFGFESVKLFGFNTMISSLLCIVVSIIIMVVLHIFMTRTKFGTSMRAAAMDPMAARSCGINVSLTTAVTWGISSAIAAVGGMLIGPLYGIFAVVGSNLGGKGFGSAILGGYGNMYGAIVGGIILGLAETFIAGYVSSMYKDMFTYAMLLLFLFVKPRGIFNEKAINE